MPPPRVTPSFQLEVNTVYHDETTETYKLEQARMFAMNTSILHCTGDQSQFTMGEKESRGI